MGSLPNLHELCRESDSDDSPELRHTAPVSGAHVIVRDGRSNKGALPPTARGYSRVLCRTRSNGNHNHMTYDDHMLMEQMTAYSPISSRSMRTISQHQVQISNLIGRRRESLSSSIGATSVRRLIGVVRNTNGRLGPVYSRHILLKNLVTVCTTHLFVSASFLPLLALQSSISAWHWPLKRNFITNLDLGSILLAILYLFASFSSLLSPVFIQKFGTKRIFILGYVTYSLFFSAHFYPIVYVLFPAYVLLGLVLGPVSLSRVTFVMTLSSKLSYIATEDEDVDENQQDSRRTCLIRRLARALQGAQDLGLILGSLITAILISYTFSNNELLKYQQSVNATTGTPSETNETSAPPVNVTMLYNTTTSATLENDVDQTVYFYASYDDLFDVDDSGRRVCGSAACPISIYFNFNVTDRGLVENFIYILPERTSAILTSTYLSCVLLAFVLACLGLDKIRLLIHQDPMERSMGLSALRAVKETFKDTRLKWSAPLAIFIGLEQGFMYADFSKSYVVCSLGIHNINLVFLSMGLLQSLSAFTLSMLLRSIRRCIVIAVGLAFHSLLIMVLILWKPSGDDPALFYVIAAAWGVCNSIWEMLNFTLLTGQFSDNWEPAFANSMLFRYLGLSMAFGVHGLLCNWIKLYLLAFFLVFAIVPYTYLEIKLENTRKLKSISRL